MNTTYYQSLIEAKLTPVQETPKDVVYMCPRCEGSTGSGHLYVNYTKGYYHCYRCDLGGKNLKSLVRLLGLDIEEEIPQSVLHRPDESVDKSLEDMIQSLKVDTPQREIRDYSVPLEISDQYFNYHTSPLSPGAYRYLLDRGLSPEEICMYGMREGLNRRGEYLGTIECKNYAGRILVPSKDSRTGLVSFFVARDYTGKAARKYLNPPSSVGYASENVWNLDVASKVSPTVIICEGVFTAIAAGRGKYNAVATYGKSIKPSSNSSSPGLSQGEKLLKAGFSTYIVAYDTDALSSLLDTCEYLYERGLNVKYIKVPPINGPHTDIADLTRETYLNLLANAEVYTPLSRLSLL